LALKNSNQNKITEYIDLGGLGMMETDTVIGHVVVNVAFLPDFLSRDYL
jgi:hypothetical protein